MKLLASTRVLIVFSVFLVAFFFVAMAVLIVLFLVSGLAAVGWALYHIISRPGLIRVGIVVAIGGLVYLFAIFQFTLALARAFLRTTHVEPALWINRNKEPELMALVERTAFEVGATPPQHVCLHVGTDLFVMQGHLTVLDAQPRGRILMLSLPHMYTLTVAELRSVLAHEFAHFTGNDLLYSTLTLPLYQAAIRGLNSLNESFERAEGLGVILLYLPHLVTNAFVHVYVSGFHIVASKISRDREFRADRIAAQYAGKNTAAEALKKVYAYSHVWNEKWSTVADVTSHPRNAGRSFFSLYRKLLPTYADLANRHLAQCLAEQEQIFDSHPNLVNRLRALPNAPSIDPNPAAAASLLRERKRYEAAASSFLMNEYRIAVRTAPTTGIASIAR